MFHIVRSLIEVLIFLTAGLVFILASRLLW